MRYGSATRSDCGTIAANQTENWLDGEKIQQLYLNGLGVYQFAELQGQHVDVMLLSLTHGVTDANGSLTRDLHFWNSQLGFNQFTLCLPGQHKNFT
ncbi:MAG: hypothetical protein R2778_04395 [Saprospiraceae bacterium]